MALRTKKFTALKMVGLLQKQLRRFLSIKLLFWQVSDSESDEPFKDIDEDEGELEENEAVIEDDTAEDDAQVDSDSS